MDLGARFIMSKKHLVFIFLILLILAPSRTFAEDMNSIMIIVDEMSLRTIEELSIDEYGVGLMNLKTRPPYSEKDLYLSINTGKKLGAKELKKQQDKLEFLGDTLKKEKVSYIGDPSKRFIVGDKEGDVDYIEDSIKYDLDWLILKTDLMLDKSKLLSISYDFDNDPARVDILRKYLSHYKKEQIIILPKTVSKEDNYILNKNLVPILYINGKDSGLLRSSSTKRDGYIAIEDISVQIKNLYGYSRKTDIGSSFQVVDKEDPIKAISKIYEETINLFIIAYVFHGIAYLTQLFLAIYLFKDRNIGENSWISFNYYFVSAIIIISFVLGLFSLHQNIILYLILNIILSYILTKFVVNRNCDVMKFFPISTYLLIIFGIIFYPTMIYNSYIGFNNLIYGARYYGLNNGIMGVLLISSILSFFSITKTINSRNTKVLIGFIIFGLNMIALSTNFGANTGGFITSIVLFAIMMYILLFSERYNFRTMFLFFLVGVVLFGINMIFDNNSGDKSHAIEFFYRLKNNGFMEFVSMASFKARELLILTISPPFSIVLISQGIILSKLRRNFINNKKIKKEAMIIIITSLIGFIINDTGVIMFIYIMHYFILYIIHDNEKIG